MERSTIENKFKWTIDEMYPNEESIEKDIQKVKELIILHIEYNLRFCKPLTYSIVKLKIICNNV